MKSSVLTVLLTSSLAMAACGGDEPSEAMPPSDGAGVGSGAGGEGPPSGVGSGGDPDVQAPSVTTTTPLDGEVGVTEKQVIAIEFSEAMDRASVESAYSSALLPADAVAFSWNDAGTVLEVEALEGLEYATGGLDDAPLEYEVTIGEAAADLAGNPLDGALTFRFSTLRHVEMSIPAEESLTGYAVRLGSSSVIVYDGTDPRAGDWLLNSNERTQRGFVAFYLDEVPEGPLDFTSVRLRAPLSKLVGTPGALGDLLVYPVFDPAFTTDAFDAEPLGPGMKVESNGGEVPLFGADLEGSVVETLANREVRDNLAQYRIGYTLDANDNGASDRVEFATGTVTLEISFLSE